MNPYSERLLGLVGDASPIAVLTATPSRLAGLHRELAGGKLASAYGPGKWTARHIFAHLADAENAVGWRVRVALTQDHPTIQPYDQDAFIGLYQTIDAGLALEAFRSARAWNLALFSSLTPEQLARGAFHPERGEEPVGRMIALLAGHDLNHLAELDAIARG